jgi:hypothetical protein
MNINLWLFQFFLMYLPGKDFCFIFAIVSGIFGLTISEIVLSFIMPRVVQIMSIIFQTGHELSIVLGSESTSASGRVRFASTIE